MSGPDVYANVSVLQGRPLSEARVRTTTYVAGPCRPLTPAQQRAKKAARKAQRKARKAGRA